MDLGNSDQSKADIDVYPETLAKCAEARRLSGSTSSLSSDLPPDLSILPKFATISATLAANTRTFPDKNWLTFYDETGLAGYYSYAEFFATVMRFAAWLQTTLNVRQGDRVATLMVNDPRAVLTYFAAWTLGITIVPLNPAEDQERILYILQDADVRVVFVFEEQRERWNSLLDALSGNTTKHAENMPLTLIGLPAFLCSADSEAAQTFFLTDPLSELPELDARTECLIVYTSGTTGPPKGVVLEQSNLLADGHSIAQWMQFGPDDRAMNVLPLHHVNGTVVTLITPLVSGGSVVINRKFSAHAFWKTLAAEKCTWVSVVPTILAFLNERKEDITQYDLSRFRRILCGAGPLTVELATRFYNSFGLRITHGYGLSETTCYSSFLPASQSEAEYRYAMHECGFPSIGCPLPVNQMQIQDTDGQSLPQDTRGEIVVRGLNVMRCYHHRPDANRDAFTHGWFRSGDEGFYRIGADGLLYFFITGRIKELIIRGGVNLSPFDVDETLNAIPGIRAAMAVGFENNFYGEEVGAYVQLERPLKDLSDAQRREIEAGILLACRQKLPYTKSPKVVVFGETFPVTSTGKYQRNKLKPLFAAWKDIQFREPK